MSQISIKTNVGSLRINCLVLLSPLWCLLMHICAFNCVIIGSVNTQDARCCEILWDFVGHFEWHHPVDIGEAQSYTEKFGRNISDFTVSTVHADGLAPLGARPSVSTVMTEFGSHIYIYIYMGLTSYGQLVCGQFDNKPLPEPSLIYWGLSVGSSGLYLSEIWIKILKFFRYACENALCKVVAIVSRSQCVKFYYE